MHFGSQKEVVRWYQCFRMPSFVLLAYAIELGLSLMCVLPADSGREDMLCVLYDAFDFIESVGTIDSKSPYPITV